MAHNNPPFRCRGPWPGIPSQGVSPFARGLRLGHALWIGRPAARRRGP